ncbi:hypothetical protein [Roseivirga sp. E12]|uniref:hypothetical protein n=1 Tax=Roseivirga sp. E12 TaxID=2819237 RepID=UPI001ABC7775|nr:hypothetical protein [Roseivirga sp. E12]MBO3697540.1 hypothetical protein [Roseivirga sp. E12]
MKKNILYSMLITGIILLNGCMADMRTALIKNEGITSENVAKGKAILDSAWKKHGFENLSKHKTYAFKATDTWRGLMGRMGKPWPEAESNVSFKFEVGTFNSQVTFLDGKREGISAGLQNWKYYEIEPGKGAEFIDVNKKINFALPAYHYFFEMVDRLKTASIISYAGEKEFRGEKYDLIICTWGSAEPHMEDDQYVAWINQKTGMMEYSEYTLRDNYLKIPGYKAFYGAIEMKDFRNIMGVMVPHEQIVYLNGVKKKEKRHVHKLRVTDFKFDSFDLKDLYPNSEDRVSGANIK